MEFVYVEGIASIHQYVRPRRKPLAFADTRSLTIIPSSFATSKLRYVRSKRKKVWRANKNISLDVDLHANAFQLMCSLCMSAKRTWV
jgi:hypothetical protein